MATRNNSKARNEIIELLKEDHQKAKKAFRTAERLHEQEATEELQALVEQTCKELEVHTQLEEELFYPAAREAIKDQDLMEEALIEHNSAKDLIAKLREMSADDEAFAPTFKVLGEYVKHHIKEEENEMFEQVGGRSNVQWEELQQQMLTMRETLMGEMGLGEEEESEAAPAPARRSRSAGRARSEQSADREETVE